MVAVGPNLGDYRRLSCLWEWSMVARALHSIFLPHDGAPRNVAPKGEFWTLQEWYDLIGCSTVEFIGVDEDYGMLFDEDGKMKELPPNAAATVYGRKAGIHPDDFVVGHALLVLRSQMD
jgi:hypothetical protein